MGRSKKAHKGENTKELGAVDANKLVLSCKDIQAELSNPLNLAVWRNLQK